MHSGIYLMQVYLQSIISSQEVGVPSSEMSSIMSNMIISKMSQSKSWNLRYIPAKSTFLLSKITLDFWLFLDSKIQTTSKWSSPQTITKNKPTWIHSSISNSSTLWTPWQSQVTLRSIRYLKQEWSVSTGKTNNFAQ